MSAMSERMIGQTVSHYKILAKLGGGGMGVVYKAEDTRLHQTVALKFLPAEWSHDPTAKERLLREAQAAFAIEHQNICRVHGVDETEDGRLFIAMAHYEGQTLDEKIEAGPLGVDDALDIATQVADGLAKAHAQSVVHRDIKPANLIITADGTVKILDFGLARIAGALRLTQAGSVLGTVAYMSPEQTGSGETDARTDVWSLGVVLYEMLTGRLPFPGEYSEAAVYAIRNDQPKPLSEAATDVSEPLERVVFKALAKDPAQRYQSASGMAAALRDSARNLADQLLALSDGSRPKAVERVPGPPSPHWRTWRTAAAIAVLALGMVTAYVVTQQEAQPLVPSFQQLTFRRGVVESARFAPDGITVIYGAAWGGGPVQLFSTRPESPESRAIELPNADILAVSSAGEMAISLDRGVFTGTLARVSLAGGGPREILSDVSAADWVGDGEELAVAREVQQRYRLEFPIGNVVYETNGWISDLRVSPDSTQVAFLDHPVRGDDKGDVSIINQNGVKETISIGWRTIEGIAWSVSGNEVWFTASDGAEDMALHAVDLSGRVRLVTRSAGRLVLQDISPTGRVLLTEGKRRIVLMFKGADDERERDLSWLDASLGSDLSSDGETLLFNEVGSGEDAESYAVYVRKADGSPAVRLGNGHVAALSPDGRWAAAITVGAQASLSLLPIGAGERITLDIGDLIEYNAVTWFPDGRRLLIGGREADADWRLYVQDVPDGTPRAVSSEGIWITRFAHPISPAGTTVAAVDEGGQVVLQPIDGGAPRPITGLEIGDRPVRWSADGQALYVFRTQEIPGRLYRLDLARSQKELFAEFMPAEPAGVRGLFTAQITPDGRAYSYSYIETLSDLYQVDDLR